MSVRKLIGFCTTTASRVTRNSGALDPRRLYILCWSELSRRKLSPTLATPTTLVLTTPVAQCELSRRKIGLLLEVVGRKFSHRPGNSATVGVVRWPAAGDTAGSSLRRLNSPQHRIYNLLGETPLEPRGNRRAGPGSPGRRRGACVISELYKCDYTDACHKGTQFNDSYILTKSVSVEATGCEQLAGRESNS